MPNECHVSHAEDFFLVTVSVEVSLGAKLANLRGVLSCTMICHCYTPAHSYLLSLDHSSNAFALGQDCRKIELHLSFIRSLSLSLSFLLLASSFNIRVLLVTILRWLLSNSFPLPCHFSLVRSCDLLLATTLPSSCCSLHANICCVRSSVASVCRTGFRVVRVCGGLCEGDLKCVGRGEPYESRSDATLSSSVWRMSAAVLLRSVIFFGRWNVKCQSDGNQWWYTL